MVENIELSTIERHQILEQERKIRKYQLGNTISKIPTKEYPFDNISSAILAQWHQLCRIGSIGSDQQSELGKAASPETIRQYLFSYFSSTRYSKQGLSGRI